MAGRDSMYKEDGTVDLHPRYTIVDDEVKKIVAVPVHEYSLDSYWDIPGHSFGARIGARKSGSEDFLLKEWIESEKGQWICKHTKRQPELIKGYNRDTYETMIKVVAFLYEEDATMFHLKWS